jgi:DNA mismatch endonuclease Vsr
MSDNLRPDDRRRTMQAVKGKGTKLEKCFFATLVGMGLTGWKKNVQTITGKPDVVFPVQRVAIFIDGCFWHGCGYCRRKLPQTNVDYWNRKIRRNISLARTYKRKLRREGWTVLRIWEHELTNKTKVRLRTRKALLVGNSLNDR